MTTPSLGLSVPHRSLDPIDPDDVIAVARAAEEQGFADVWVTNNALDSSADCLDSLGVLNFVAAQTERVGLGVSVLVLPIYHPIHVAHGVASLDWLSGGRAMLGLGLGRESELEEFGVSTERRVGRFLEQLAIIMDRHAPFGVVIVCIKLGMRAKTARSVINGVGHGATLAWFHSRVTRDN